MPTILFAAVLAIGAFAAFRLFRKEWRRINAELDIMRRGQGPAHLRRDPETGIWSPSQDTRRP